MESRTETPKPQEFSQLVVRLIAELTQAKAKFDAQYPSSGLVGEEPMFGVLTMDESGEVSETDQELVDMARNYWRVANGAVEDVNAMSALLNLPQEVADEFIDLKGQAEDSIQDLDLELKRNQQVLDGKSAESLSHSGLLMKQVYVVNELLSDVLVDLRDFPTQYPLAVEKLDKRHEKKGLMDEERYHEAKKVMHTHSRN